MVQNALAELSPRQQASAPMGLRVDYTETIRKQLQAVGLPQDAGEWLVSVWRLTQFFDDVADGDAVNRADLDAVLWDALIGMNTNPFFVARRVELLPVMALQIQKWQASDAAERAGRANAKSFMWRAGFYDLVLFVYMLCCGNANPEAPLSIYGETLEAYLREFPNA